MTGHIAGDGVPDEHKKGPGKRGTSSVLRSSQPDGRAVVQAANQKAGRADRDQGRT